MIIAESNLRSWKTLIEQRVKNWQGTVLQMESTRNTSAFLLKSYNNLWILISRVSGINRGYYFLTKCYLPPIASQFIDFIH